MTDCYRSILRLLKLRVTPVLASLLLAASASALDDANPQLDRRVIGTWKIVSVLDYAQISVGEAPAKKLVGKTLLVSADKTEFGDRRCEESSLRAESVETNIELDERARVGNDKLRLPNPVTVVELSCAYIYVRNNDRMVLAWNGIFFDIVRIKKSMPAPPRKPRHD